MKLHRVLALTVLFAVLASLGLRPAFAAAPSDQAGLVLLTAPTTPELRALAARFPSRPAPLAADASAARAALSRARALVADVGALSADLIRRSQWFAQAHALGVPIVLAHADA